MMINFTINGETYELDVCPFCKGDDIVLDDGVFAFWVSCKTCRSSGPMCSTEEEAAREWNDCNRGQEN